MGIRAEMVKRDIAHREQLYKMLPLGERSEAFNRWQAEHDRINLEIAEEEDRAEAERQMAKAREKERDDNIMEVHIKSEVKVK